MRRLLKIETHSVACFGETVTRRVPEIISGLSQVAARIFRIQDG